MVVVEKYWSFITYLQVDSKLRWIQIVYSLNFKREKEEKVSKKHRREAFAETLPNFCTITYSWTSPWVLFHRVKYHFRNPQRQERSLPCHLRRLLENTGHSQCCWTRILLWHSWLQVRLAHSNSESLLQARSRLQSLHQGLWYPTHHPTIRRQIVWQSNIRISLLSVILRP